MHVSLDSALGRQRRLNSVGESITQIAPNPTAAYSLRSLTGSDPLVVNVRRGTTDNDERTFTVSEINSGYLVNWVNEGNGVFQNTGYESFTNASATGFTASNTGGSGNAVSSIVNGVSGDVVKISFDIDITNGSPKVSLRGNMDGSGQESNTVTLTSSGSQTITLTANDNYVGVGFPEGDVPSNFTVSNFKVLGNGFVETWYDQSGNSNNAVQATAGSQPKIVSSGSLIAGGLRFDDAQKLETSGTFSFASGTTLSTFITNSSDADETSYLFRFLANYILLNTGSGLRRANAGSNANAGTASGSEELWSTISTLNSSGGTTNFFVDGTLASSADANIGTNVVSSRNLNIGGSSSSNHWNGTINEVIFYATDQTSNRPALDANIISHYGIS